MSDVKTISKTIATAEPSAKGTPSGGKWATKLAAIRAAAICAVSEEDVFEMVFAVMEKAKKGDAKAFEAIMNRILGRPIDLELAHEIEQIKNQLNMGPIASLEEARERAEQEVAALKLAKNAS